MKDTVSAAGCQKLGINNLAGGIVTRGILIDLAETAARLKRWEFMLVAAPIATPGGTGSPLNPLAIF